MAGRLGLGPVFAFEWLMASRRWQSYAMRSLTVVLLFGVMSLVWSGSSAARTGSATIAQQVEVGRTFYQLTGAVLLGLVGLAAPAATAGAICLDKARGNLTLLFATDLSDAEIVLGKLGARLVPVVGLILCAAPVLAIATLFGGIDPVGLTGALMVVLSCAVFGCALALTLSVWGKKTHEVLMATYVFGILYVLAAPIASVILPMLPASWRAWIPTFWTLLGYNPIYLVLSAVNRTSPPFPTVTIGTQARFLGLGLAASSALIGAAIWRIRRVVIGQLGRGEGASKRRGWRWFPAQGRRVLPWPGPSLDGNPVLWRECQRRRPSGWNLAIWGIYLLLCGGFSVRAILEVFGRVPWGPEDGVIINCVQVGIGLLLLSVSAATSLAEERQRGSLDVLMATPLSTRSIVWGKWWGSFRAVPPLLVLPVAVGLALAWREGHVGWVPLLAASILAYGAAITSLGLALATWIPRLGRAVAATVSCYVFMCLGWMFLIIVVNQGALGMHGNGLASGSPLMGVGSLSAMLGGLYSGLHFHIQGAWMFFWTIAYVVAALILLLATLATFNRCLGRIDPPSLREDADLVRGRDSSRGSA